MQANHSLAGYKTPPSVGACLLHAVATELRHEKAMLKSPEEQDLVSRWLAVKPVVTQDGVLYLPLIVTAKARLKILYKINGVFESKIPDFRFHVLRSSTCLAN